MENKGVKTFNLINNQKPLIDIIYSPITSFTHYYPYNL